MAPVRQVQTTTVVPVRQVVRITAVLVRQVRTTIVVTARLVVRIAEVPARLDRRGMLLHPVQQVHVLFS